MSFPNRVSHTHRVSPPRSPSPHALHRVSSPRSRTLLAIVTSIAVGAMLLALACVPAVEVKIRNPFGPTDLAVSEGSINGTSFVLQWVAPTDTGTKADGTPLSFEELVYRIYYLVRTEYRTRPIVAESVKQHPATQVQEVTGVLQARITGLEPETRYLVVVASYNSFAELETVSSEVVPTSTGNDSTAPGAVTDLDIDRENRESSSFVLRWVAPANTGTKADGTALDPSEISYRIYYRAGTIVQAEPSAELLKQNHDTQVQEVAGVLQARIVGLEPETRYFVTVESYNSFEPQLETMPDKVVEINTSADSLDFEGSLAYEETTHEFIVGLIDTIAPTSTPAVPGTDTSGAITRYVLEKIDGTEFVPEPVVAENGVVTIDSITNTGTARYFVRAQATNYDTQNVTITIVVKKADFRGSIGYARTRYSFMIGLAGTIVPIDTPTIPSSDPNNLVIRYLLTKSSGTEFSSEPVIDGSGIITINPISNRGTATYLVQAEADGYNTQEVALTITIVTARFEGNLAYKPTEYEFAVGLAGIITPESTPTIPSISSESISYSITRDTSTEPGSTEPAPAEFDLAPSIAEDSGIITINPTSTVGRATYLVKATADGFVSQEARLSIAILESIREDKLQVSTYYSNAGETTNIFPVDLGQAIKYNGMFSLADSDTILTISDLTDGDHTIHFGTEVDGGANNYNRVYQRTASNGVIAISKLELMDNFFSFTDGAVIAISGPDIGDIKHVATYRPSNIYKYQDLQAMREDLDRAYVLKKNIVFPATNADTGTSTVVSNYEAVGDSSTPFTGNLDGMGYSITGIEIESAGNYQGLFGAMEANVVDVVTAQNLVLRDFKITGNEYVGSLTGWVKRGTIKNVRVEVSDVDIGKVAAGGYGGGLLGRAGEGLLDTQVRIQNTSSATAVLGTGASSSRIGGLVGDIGSDVELTESYATGPVTGPATGGATGSAAGSGDYIGGLVGNSRGTIAGYATGSVTGRSDNVGGLVGWSSGTVTGYATGLVSGNDGVGGLVGQNNSGTVTGYATGSVTGSSFAGGLVGYNSNAIVTGYATGLVTGENSIGGLVGGSIGGTMTGYARGVVRRNGGTNFTFGKTVGSDSDRSLTTYSSAGGSAGSSEPESQIYDGATGTTLLADTTGIDGIVVAVDDSTTQAVFLRLTFGTTLGEWTWVAGKWPAINIGEELEPAADQPVNP